jgi:hypothetical protein
VAAAERETIPIHTGAIDSFSQEIQATVLQEPGAAAEHRDTMAVFHTVTVERVVLE